jgi:hypothetical protein
MFLLVYVVVYIQVFILFCMVSNTQYGSYDSSVWFWNSLCWDCRLFFYMLDGWPSSSFDDLIFFFQNIRLFVCFLVKLTRNLCHMMSIAFYCVVARWAWRWARFLEYLIFMLAFCYTIIYFPCFLDKAYKKLNCVVSTTSVHRIELFIISYIVGFDHYM